MGLVFAGRSVEVPGVPILSYQYDPTLRLAGKDFEPRQIPRGRSTPWVHMIVVHGTIGDLPCRVLPGAGATGGARATLRAWQGSTRSAGAHIVIDTDGSAICCADLVWDHVYHAKACNEASVGIELHQDLVGGASCYYAVQLVSLLAILDTITRELGIQRQIPWPYLGEDHPVPRLASGGYDFVGVCGHRDCDPCVPQAHGIGQQRGPGDPGDPVMQAIADAGYERFRVDHDEDRQTWRLRQRAASPGLLVDGVPGDMTVGVLRAQGRPHGLWLARPGD